MCLYGSKTDQSWILHEWKVPIASCTCHQLRGKRVRVPSVHSFFVLKWKIKKRILESYSVFRFENEKWKMDFLSHFPFSVLKMKMKKTDYEFVFRLFISKQKTIKGMYWTVILVFVFHFETNKRKSKSIIFCFLFYF
jgi:hypothetical protein